MKIEGLTKVQTETELQFNFDYYDYYKEFLDVTYEGKKYSNSKFRFKEDLLGKFYELDARSYDLFERVNVIETCLSVFNSFSFFENTKHSFLIIHEYKQFPWIPKSFRGEKIIKEKSPLFFPLSSSYGIKIRDGNINTYLSQFFFFPFLLNYLDINILIYSCNYFYRINHHLTVFKINIQKKD